MTKSKGTNDKGNPKPQRQIVDVRDRPKPGRHAALGYGCAWSRWGRLTVCRVLCTQFFRSMLLRGSWDPSSGHRLSRNVRKDMLIHLHVNCGAGEFGEGVNERAIEKRAD